MDQLEEDRDFTTQHQLQRKTDKLTKAARRVGLNISKTKTQNPRHENELQEQHRANQVPNWRHYQSNQGFHVFGSCCKHSGRL